MLAQEIAKNIWDRTDKTEKQLRKFTSQSDWRYVKAVQDEYNLKTWVDAFLFIANGKLAEQLAKPAYIITTLPDQSFTWNGAVYCIVDGRLYLRNIECVFTGKHAAYEFIITLGEHKIFLGHTILTHTAQPLDT